MKRPPEVTSLDEVYAPLSSAGDVFFSLKYLPKAITEYGINYDVDYQRGHVWTRRQKALFVGFLLEGGRTLPGVLNAGPNGDMHPCEVVDGKQRMVACLDWLAGKTPAAFVDGRVAYCKHLNQRDQTRMSTSIGLNFSLVRMSRRDVLKYYIKLNRGGTVHTDHEIDNVRKLLELELQHAGE